MRAFIDIYVSFVRQTRLCAIVRRTITEREQGLKAGDKSHTMSMTCITIKIPNWFFEERLDIIDSSVIDIFYSNGNYFNITWANVLLCNTLIRLFLNAFGIRSHDKILLSVILITLISSYYKRRRTARYALQLHIWRLSYQHATHYQVHSILGYQKVLSSIHFSRRRLIIFICILQYN